MVKMDGYSRRAHFDPFRYPNSQPESEDPGKLGLAGPPYELEVTKRNFIWTLATAESVGTPENFNEEYFRKNTFPSPIFAVGLKDNRLCRLQVNQHHWLNGVRYISIYVWLLPRTGQQGFKPLTLGYQVQLLNAQGAPVYARQSGLRSFFPKDCYGWRQFARYSDVMDHVVDNKLTFRVILEAYTLRAISSRTETSPQASVDQSQRMDVDVQRPYVGGLAGGAQDEPEVVNAECGGEQDASVPAAAAVTSNKLKLSKVARKKMRLCSLDVPDGPVQIQTALGIFRVNKLLIAARCPKLYSMLETGREQSRDEEGATPCLDLSEEESGIVRSLFEFLYTNKTELLEDGQTFTEQLKLFELARKYEVTDLLKKTFKALLKHVSISNWLQLMELCREQEAELKDAHQRLNQFFIQNRAELMEAPKFQAYLEAHPEFLMTHLVLRSHPNPNISPEEIHDP